MNFGEVLTRAWEIIWKNKILWLFGLLAGLASTGDSGSNIQFNFESDKNLPWVNEFFGNIPGWAIALLVLLGIVLFFAALLLSTLGRAGLARGAWLADSGQPKLTFRRVFAESRAYFVRVLVLEILLFAAGLTLIFVLVVPSALTLGLALLCLWPLFCLLVPFFIALSVLSRLAIIAITGESLGAMDGLRRAWEIMRANLIQVFGMAIVLWLGGAVIGGIAGLPAALMLAPLFINMVQNGGEFIRTGSLVGLGVFVLYLPVLLAVNAVLTSYIDTAWALVFRRLTGRTAGSETLHPSDAPNPSDAPAQPEIVTL